MSENGEIGQQTQTSPVPSSAIDIDTKESFQNDEKKKSEETDKIKSKWLI